MARRGQPEYTYKPRRKDESAELKRKAVVYGFVVVAVSGLLLYFGPALLIGIGSVGQNLSNTKSPIEGPNKNEIGVELPPQLDSLPVYSNKDMIELKGSGVSGHVIEVIVNGEKIGETVIGSDNQFNFLNVRLKEGENSIEIDSKSLGGEKSGPVTAKVIYDRKPPKLELNPPNTDMSVAKETTQVTISGTTDIDATVTVNDLQVVINSDGTFRKVVGIKDGENAVKVESQDLAGNKKTLEFKITR